MGMHHVGNPVERPTELKGSPTEKGKSLQIVGKTRLSPGSIYAVTPVQDLVVKEINRHLGIGKPALVDSTPLVLFAERYSQRAVDALHTPNVDRVVAREDDPHVVTLSLKLRRQRRYHVAKPARFCERDHFTGDHEDFETRVWQRDPPDYRHKS